MKSRRRGRHGSGENRTVRTSEKAHLSPKDTRGLPAALGKGSEKSTSFQWRSESPMVNDPFETAERPFPCRGSAC